MHIPISGKRYRNDAEAQFQSIALRKGWQITKRGWPDFICFDEKGAMFVVEVKRVRKSRPGMASLKLHQVLVMKNLAAVGIPCFVSNGSSLEPFDEIKHGSEFSEDDLRRDSTPSYSPFSINDRDMTLLPEQPSEPE